MNVSQESYWRKEFEKVEALAKAKGTTPRIMRQAYTDVIKAFARKVSLLPWDAEAEMGSSWNSLSSAVKVFESALSEDDRFKARVEDEFRTFKAVQSVIREEEAMEKASVTDARKAFQPLTKPKEPKIPMLKDLIKAKTAAARSDLRR